MSKSWDAAEAASAIRLVYRRILQREVDDSGLIGWSSQLCRGERRLIDIISLIGKSDEYRHRFIIRLTPHEAAKLMYAHFMARDPDLHELNELANVIAKDGANGAIDHLLSRPEYFMRFGIHGVPIP